MMTDLLALRRFFGDRVRHRAACQVRDHHESDDQNQERADAFANRDAALCFQLSPFDRDRVIDREELIIPAAHQDR